MCEFCETGGRKIKSIDKRWWNPDALQAKVPFIRATALLNPIPEIEVHVEMFNQYLVSEVPELEPYSIEVGFEIHYCPMCGRKLSKKDKTLMTNFSYDNGFMD